MSHVGYVNESVKMDSNSTTTPRHQSKRPWAAKACNSTSCCSVHGTNNAFTGFPSGFTWHSASNTRWCKLFSGPVGSKRTSLTCKDWLRKKCCFLKENLHLVPSKLNISNLTALGLPGQAEDANSIDVQRRNLITTRLQSHQQVIRGFLIDGSSCGIGGTLGACWLCSFWFQTSFLRWVLSPPGVSCWFLHHFCVPTVDFLPKVQLVNDGGYFYAEHENFVHDLNWDRPWGEEHWEDFVEHRPLLCNIVVERYLQGNLCCTTCSQLAMSRWGPRHGRTSGSNMNNVRTRF